jgi:poly-gamma-glutamate capsule biosynthesis protein CapA/YwtB (metallophosphatase superfamily)
MRSVKRSPVAVALVALVVLLAAAFGSGLLPTGSSAPSPSPGSTAVGEASPPGQSAAEPSAEPSDGAASPAPTPTGPVASMAVVPVTNFRATATRTSIAEVKSVLAGTSSRYQALELVRRDATAILEAVGAARPEDPDRLVLVSTAKRLTADLAAHRDRLAIMRADDVTPAVRALAWGRHALFGGDRVARLADWPFKAILRAAKDPYKPAYNPARAWTLVAGGDILLDRGVAKTVKIDGRGVNFPFSGGTATITGRCKDCSSMGWDLPYTHRTGNSGAVRALLLDADLAIANFENPAPDNYTYHTSGTRFSADPRLIDGLMNAGIDYVSLANNHIRDAGGQGILDTIKNLDDRGIAHSGAGKNVAAAHRPAIMKVGKTRVAILGYDTIAPGYAATATSPGSARLTGSAVRTDVRAARRAGADVVIVFPHWGSEYDPTPFAGQARLARACIDAGADIVIGNHAHWAGAMEVYKGKPIWYALGNFVFDQTWSEPTMEGITLELTFQGKKLVQVRMRPHIILDKAQPNFMDPAGSGRVVMGQVFGASRGLLPW